jgi:hypothetical protein
VKTDARDALHLARLLRLDEIVSVRIPTPAEEAARDLVRAREAARQDLMRARHRLSKLLLRHGIVYSGGKAWTELHDRWLRRQRFDSIATQAASEDAYETVVLATARRARLDEKITALAGDSEFTPLTRRLACLRGISTLTGFALAVEIGDWERFTGGSIGAYLGLVPSEHSSGQSRVQGAITKTGNTHVRRLRWRLGVACWSGASDGLAERGCRSESRPRSLPIRARPGLGGGEPSGQGQLDHRRNACGSRRHRRPGGDPGRGMPRLFENCLRPAGRQVLDYGSNHPRRGEPR